MKMQIKLIASALALLALIVGLGNSFNPEDVSYRPQTALGALTGPDIQSPYLNVGGVRHEYRSKDLGTSTTTPCSLQAPSSTSTLVYASLKVNVASSTATVWSIAKATTPYATTTAINSFTLASAVQGTFVQIATTTAGAADASVSTIAPNDYVVWGLAGIGTSYDSTKLTGVCNAEFIVN